MVEARAQHRSMTNCDYLQETPGFYHELLFRSEHYYHEPT